MDTEYQKQQKAVAAAVARHPGEFGLRHAPGARFMVVGAASYWSEREGCPLLYTYRWDEAEGRWLSYAKGTEAELNQQKCPL